MGIVKKILDGISAGILITIGGTVFLACPTDATGVRTVGAILFSVALLCICIKGYSLFTGKVGFLPENHSKDAWSVLLWGLLGNTVSTLLLGRLMRAAIPAVGNTAEAVCNGKLEGQEWWQTLVRAVFCGILMYLAVSIYKEKQTVVGIIFCIPVFILSGFEHSIADMFYFGASGIVSWEAVLFLVIVVIGNSIGGVLLPLITKLGNLGKKA